MLDREGTNQNYNCLTIFLSASKISATLLILALKKLQTMSPLTTP